MLYFSWTPRTHVVQLSTRYLQRAPPIRHDSSTPHKKPLKYYTKDEDRLIRERLATGADFSAIADELCRTPMSVYSRFNQHLRKELPGTQQRQFTKEDDDLIVQRRLEGVSTTLVAQELGRHVASVRRRWSTVLRYRSDVHSSPPLEGRKIPLLGGMAADEAAAFITKRLHEGGTFKLIAQELKCRPALVSYRYNKVCAPHERRSGKTRRPYSDEEVKIIKRRRSEGGPVATIAQELGRSYGSLSNFLANLRSVEGTPIHVHVKRFTPAEDQQILEMRATGATYAAIAARLGRQQSTVCARFFHLKGQPKRRLTRAEKDGAIGQYDAGINVRQIAKGLNRSHGAMIRILNTALFRRGRPLLPAPRPGDRPAKQEMSSPHSLKLESDQSPVLDDAATRHPEEFNPARAVATRA